MHFLGDRSLTVNVKIVDNLFVLGAEYGNIFFSSLELLTLSRPLSQCHTAVKPQQGVQRERAPVFMQVNHGCMLGECISEHLGRGGRDVFI